MSKKKQSVNGLDEMIGHLVQVQWDFGGGYRMILYGQVHEVEGNMIHMVDTVAAKRSPKSFVKHVENAMEPLAKGRIWVNLASPQVTSLIDMTDNQVDGRQGNKFWICALTPPPSVL